MNLLSKVLSKLRGSSTTVEDLELDLLEAGVSPRAVDMLKEYANKGTSIRDVLLNILIEGKITNEKKFLLVGVNGSGKTTVAAKLAHWFKKKGRDVTVAAADTFRAGSIEQLEEWQKIVGFKLVKYHYGADPAAVAYEAVERADDVVIIDTAGRQETRDPLMKELKKVKNVTDPDLTLMVVDATQGVSAVEQAIGFNSVVGIDGFIVTKMDIDQKGGVIVSLAAELHKPLFFVSYGQSLDTLSEFSKLQYVDNLLGSS